MEFKTNKDNIDAIGKILNGRPEGQKIDNIETDDITATVNNGTPLGKSDRHTATTRTGLDYNLRNNNGKPCSYFCTSNLTNTTLTLH